MATITAVRIYDTRFDLPNGAGSDAMHTDPQYGYAVTVLETDAGLVGTGIAYTLGGGTNLICEAIKLYAPRLIGKQIGELMPGFGKFQKSLADDQALRWLGPHKGTTHAALASLTNACFDLWAREEQKPLWKLLLDLSPEQLVDLIDLSYLEDVLPREEAIGIVASRMESRKEREGVLREGYCGYDTSAGWFNYSDEKLRDNVKKALDTGFQAVKLKVGSVDMQRDVRRALLIRELLGDDKEIMVDANQVWSVPAAIRACLALAPVKPYWVEEPTQPDDILGHQVIARVIAPSAVAVGEAVANRVLWKNFFQASAVGIVQADCTRLAGISEYLAVTILATKYPVRVIPHVGDMGQIHSHLVLFNHIALGHAKLFLEYIPHLRQYFAEPVVVREGRYRPSELPGCGTAMNLEGVAPLAVVTGR